MTKFSDPERFLITEWADVRMLEEAIKTLHKKYEGLFDEVVDKVTRKYRILDYPKIKVGPKYGYVAIGKKSWPEDRSYDISGFWLEYIELENLTSTEKESPYAYIWVSDKRLNWEEIESALVKAAEAILSKEELDRMKHGVEEGGAWYGFQIDRSVVTELLLAPDTSGFVSYFVAQFDWMAKFIPIMDELLVPKPRRRK